MAKISRMYLIWGLSTDSEALGQFLENADELLNQAGPEVCAALGRADFRENEEYHQLKKAAYSLSLEAGRLHSQRLEDAANVLRAMMGPFRIEPKAPGKTAHKETGKAGGDTRAARYISIKRAMVAEYRGLRFSNPADAARELEGSYVEKLESAGLSVPKNPDRTLYTWFIEADTITV